MNASPTSALFLAARFDVVAIAASAGGIKALAQLLPQLPADFAAAIVIVMHLAPTWSACCPRS
jgi:two-component system, chemotaxis family, protein-glutamate methylesterase/glutaminase